MDSRFRGNDNKVRICLFIPVFRENPMPKIDVEAIAQSNATGYPAPFDAEVQGRYWRRLA